MEQQLFPLSWTSTSFHTEVYSCHIEKAQISMDFGDATSFKTITMQATIPKNSSFAGMTIYSQSGLGQ